MLEVRGRPPIAHAPLGVKGAAFGVKRVADFVTDDGADGAIVGRGGGLRIEERRLQNGGREVERVLQREIDGIHRLRRHAPFLAIHGTPEARDFAVVLKQAAAPEVAEDIVRP